MTLIASHGWLKSVKNCGKLGNIKVHSEATSVNTVATKEFLRLLQIRHLPQQVFNDDKMGSFCRKCQIEGTLS